MTNKKCFIIAEAGVNHNGNVDLAKELIDVASKCRANAVKFQTYKTEDLVTNDLEMAQYQAKNIGKKTSQRAMLKSLELTYEDFIELKKHCDKRRIIFLSTPHTEDAVDFLEDLVEIYKVASGDLTNPPFLKKIAMKKKPIILSTGMGTLCEIEEAVTSIKKIGNDKITLLHCVTNYPADIKDLNLNFIKTLNTAFKLPVGFSDHSLGITASIAAVAIGAKVLEKHFTIDKDMEGPDHKASLDPDELKKLVISIREVEKALGDGIKKLTLEEEELKKIIRKAIVANTDIISGSILTKEMLCIKRSGVGIEPKRIQDLIGKETIKNIKKNQKLSWDMIA